MNLTIAFFIIGLLIGWIITYFVTKKTTTEKEKIIKELEIKLIEQQKQTEIERNRANFLNVQIKELTEKTSDEINNAQKILNEQLLLAQNKINELNQRLEKSLAHEASLLEKNKLQEEKINELEQQLVSKTNEHLKEIETLNQKLTEQFKNIANEILNEKSKTFTEQNKENISSILNPLKEKIDFFQLKVENTFKSDTADRAGLRQQIEQLTKLNQQVSAEANNLVKALKGNNKTQGNWGEMLLEKILERSGLRKNIEYTVQHHTQNNEGKNIKPDVIINLPDNKHIIIDSKVSLIAFEQFVNAEDDLLKERFKKEHIQSLRQHIKNLAEKNYQTSDAINSPDMVLMFIPIESGFSLALEADPEIYSFAWDKKIVLVSPTTLLATLRTVASIWKQENQVKYAKQIAKMAADLYDKFVLFLTDFSKIGERIKQSQDVYEQAFDKLSRGKGNIVSRINKFKEYGIHNSKNISDKFISDETDE